MSNFETILEIIRKKVTIYYIYWNPYIAEKGHFCFDRIPLKWDKRLLPCSLRRARKWLALVLFKYLCIDFMFTLKVQTFIWQKKNDCWRCLLNNHYYDDSTDSTMIIQQNSTALMGKKTAHEAEGNLGSGTISWLRPGLFSTLEFALVHWLTAQRTFFEPSWSHWLENWILLPAGDSFILLENFNDSETGGSWRGLTEYEPEWSFVIGLLRSPQTVHNNKIHGHMSLTLECRKGPKSQSLSPSGVKLAPSGGKFYTWPWAS